MMFQHDSSLQMRCTSNVVFVLPGSDERVY